jgi:crotonobetainyl-CoA:carnitine CoA-transferase CaiB-like acyl-CoA transferase
MTLRSLSSPGAEVELDLPLRGVRVVDMASGQMAAIGRQLAELGAEVVRVEPPGGAAEQCGGRAVAGIDLDFVIANLGKRSIELDLAEASDRDAFERLLLDIDIVIENSPPGSAQWTTLDTCDLHQRFPTLVILSVSAFGQHGALSRWQATDPVLHALSGELSRSGIPGRAPLLPPGNLATGCGVQQAVFAVLLAYFNALNTGLGDYLDFSLLDGAAQALDPGHGMAGSASAGMAPNRALRGRPDARQQYPIIPCRDGMVRLCVLNPRQWQAMFE